MSKLNPLSPPTFSDYIDPRAEARIAAKEASAANFWDLYVVALDDLPNCYPNRWVVWAEREWLRLPLRRRVTLSPVEIWKNGKVVEGRDLHSLSRTDRRR